MRPLPQALGTALLLLFPLFAAGQQTISVFPGPNAIQNAIDNPSTVNGDTIVVYSRGTPDAPSVYSENIDFKGKNLIITSTLATDAASQLLAARSTVIDGGFTAPTVSSTTPTTAGGFNVPAKFPGPTLSYFTIRNGGFPFLPGGGNSTDGGVYVTTTDGLHIVGNIFIGNNGGVVIDGGLAYVFGNTFTNNNCWSVLVYEAGAGVIYNNMMTATQTPDAGCAYQDFYQMPKGIPSAIVLDGENSNNTENYRSVIYGNTLTDTGPGATGITIYSGGAYIESNTIKNQGGAIDILGGDSIEIDNNVMVANEGGCGGGAIAFKPAELVNLSPDPGNLFANHYSLLVANNTMVNNYSANNASPGCDAGQQIHTSSFASPAVAFVGNIIYGNTAGASISCGVSPVESIANQAVFDHNMVFNSGGPIFDTSCIDESAAPLNALFGNVIASPSFTNSTINPYQLATGSAGIDAGNNGVLLSVATQEGFDTYPFSLYNYYYPDLLISPYTPNPAAPPYLGPEDNGQSLRFQDATKLVDQSSQQLDIIDIGAYEASGTTSSSDDGIVTMFMPPTGYTDMVGPSTLFAEIVSGSGLDKIPPGTVTFFMDGSQVGNPSPITPIGNPLTPGAPAGSASVPVDFAPGTHVLTATYQPAPNQPVPAVPEAQSVAVVVNITSTPTSLKLSATPLDVYVGSPVTFTVTAPPAYNGYIPTPVSIFNNSYVDNAGIGALVGTVTPDPKTGIGTLTTDNNLFLGLNDIQASFAGSGIYQPSVSNTVIVKVGQPTAITLAVSPSPTAQAFAPITFTANVTTGATGVPSGSVTFYSDTAATQPINSAEVKNGVATLIAGLPGGTYNITAVYTGDATFGMATSNSVAETVLPDSTTLTLASAINPGVANELIPIKATLAISVPTVPNGLAYNIINFFSDGVSIGSEITGADGSAMLEHAFPVGTYTLTASFAGNASYNASNSNSVIEVIKQNVNTSTTTALAVTPNPGYPASTETLTATVARSPQSTSMAALTGTVAFFDGATMLASSPVDATGVATFSSTAFTIGSHSLTAVYSGDATYQASTSAVVILNILSSDFSITTDPSITIKTEGHGSLNVTLAALGSFADTVIVGCSNPPAYVSCNFPGGGTQASFSLANGAAVTTAIDIDTDALLNFASVGHSHPDARFGRGITLALLLPLTLFAARRRGRHMRLIVALFAMAIAATLTGCSGHQPGHTPPGTYNLIVVAKGSATGVTHMANVTLIVTE